MTEWKSTVPYSSSSQSCIAAPPGLGICSSIFWANHSFLAKNEQLSDLLTLLIKKDGMSESLVKKKHTKNAPKSTILQYYSNFFERIAHSLIYPERPERIAHSCSFVMSDLSDLLTVALLTWVTWANHSQSLIWFERSEQMSEWAMSKWAMSKWANSQPCFFF